MIRSLFLITFLLTLAWPDLSRAAVASGESNVLAVDTRNLGVGGESGVTVVDTRVPFTVWSAASGLLPPLDQLEEIPYDDGATNLCKYAFNMDGTKADSHTLPPGGTSGWPYGEIVMANNVPVLRLVSVRRKNDPGLQYTARFTRDRVNWIYVPTPQDITPLSDYWERVSYQVPASEAPSTRWFGQVQVTYTP